jgi:hypothetical protein
MTLDVVPNINIDPTSLPQSPVVSAVRYRDDSLTVANSLSKMISNALIIRNVTVNDFHEKFDIIRQALMDRKVINVQMFNGDEICDEILGVKSISYGINIMDDIIIDRIYLSNSELHFNYE